MRNSRPITQAFLDYDNAKILREFKSTDVKANLTEIIEAVTLRIAATIETDDIVLRLYGGWLDIAGRLTRQGICCRGRRVPQPSLHLRTTNLW